MRRPSAPASKAENVVGQVPQANFGAPEGKKELVGLIDGVRESAQSWKELLLDLKRRGLSMGPELAVADGALGFGKPSKRYGPTRAGNAAGCTRPPMSSTSCR